MSLKRQVAWNKVITARTAAHQIFNRFAEILEGFKRSGNASMTKERQQEYDTQKENAEKNIRVLKTIIEYFAENTKEFNKQDRKLKIKYASVDEQGNLLKKEGEFCYKPEQMIDLEAAIEELGEVKIFFPVLVLPIEDLLPYEVFNELVAFGDPDKPEKAKLPVRQAPKKAAKKK